MRFFVAQLGSTNNVGMHDLGGRQSEAFQHPQIPFPQHIALRRPARQPSMPKPAYTLVQQEQALIVAANAKVGVVPLEHPAKSLMLGTERPMPHPLASLIDRLERAGKLPSLLPHAIFESARLEDGTPNSSHNGLGTAVESLHTTVIGLSPLHDRNSTGPQ
jgi:hypothetical protein